MRKQVLLLGVLAMVALLASPALAASRGASFTPLGLFDEGFPLTTAVSVSGDGEKVTGQHAFGTGVYLWTEADGLNTVGPAGAGYLSRDGNTLAATYFDDTFTWGWSSIWTGGFYPEQTWNRLPLAAGFAPCGGSGQSTFGVSNNFVVGLTWIDEDGNGNGCEGARAFAWSEATGTFVLDDSLSGTGSYRANAVNDDGSVITGWSAPGRTASAWINNVETYLCPEDWFCNEGWDVTPDGATILFTGASPEDFNVRASLYDVATGAIEQLPFPDAPFDPFWDSFAAFGISDDGKTVVGEFGGGGFFGSPPYPVLWNRDLGFTLDLQVFLLGQGLDDLAFWFLTDGNDVSSDGKVIVGQGRNPDGWIEAYRVDITKVKVCHKPDGNDRTLAINWDSVPDHLAHGDILSTCEFAGVDGASRAIERLGRERRSADPMADGRVSTMEQLNLQQSKSGGNTYDLSALESFKFDRGRQQRLSEEEMQLRRESLKRRILRHMKKRR